MRYNNNTIKLCVLWGVFFMAGIILVGASAVARERRSGDEWLGKWEMKAMYTETARVWDWWFVISRKVGNYTIETHTQSPAKILFINETKLEFDFNDELKTNIKVSHTGPNSAEGEVHQPNNTGLPHGRVAGTRRPELVIKEILFVKKPEPPYEEIKEISYGEPFYIKVEFDSEPEEVNKTVTLDWGEGTGKPIIVNQQDNKEIFLSDVIYAKRPTASKESE